MARAVVVWTWRRALRDRGPRSPSVLLTLHTISTFMNRDGFAYPSQQTIAAGARTSVRSVQRHIREALRDGWLAVEEGPGFSGQGWRRNVYRTAVPDELELDEQDDEFGEAVERQFGDVESLERDDRIVSSPITERGDTILSSRRGSQQKGDDTGGPKVTTNQAKADDTGDAKVTTQLCRTNSGSELRYQKNSPTEEAHYAQSRVARTVIEDDGWRDPDL